MKENKVELLPFDPQKDSALIEMVKQIEKTKKASSQIMVLDDASFNEAGGFVKIYSDYEKAIEKKRKRIVDPLNKLIKSINNHFKTVAEMFQSEHQRLRSEMNSFLALKRAKEEAEMKEIEDVIGETAEPLLTESKIKTESVTTFKSKTWELIDINLVPREYLILDEKKINEIRRDSDLYAESSIPGIKFTVTEKIKTY